MSFRIDEVTRAAWCIILQNFERPRKYQFDFGSMTFPKMPGEE